MCRTTYSSGGQRRTVETPCGWICQGHPTEVNKKFERHKRYCNKCQCLNMNEEPHTIKRPKKMEKYGWSVKDIQATI